MSGAEMSGALVNGHPLRVEGNRQWVEFDVVTRSGRSACIRFRVRLDVVEVWRGEHSCAVIDRERLREWLRAMPDAVFEADEIQLSVDRCVDYGGRVAFSMPDVTAWTLSPVAESLLRDRI